jgi:hypothetical protein
MSIWLQLSCLHNVNTIYILPDEEEEEEMKSSPYVSKYVIRCLAEIP